MKAMDDMQGTYEHWSAQLFSYFSAANAATYVFQMQVDNAARLWVNDTLVINACMSLAPQACTLHIVKEIALSNLAAAWHHYILLEALPFDATTST